MDQMDQVSCRKKWKKYVMEEDDCYQIKDFLIKATLMNLREGVRDYARHECQGCRIDHPSQKHHDLCLWTSPQEWIQDNKYHVSISIMSWKTGTRLSVIIWWNQTDRETKTIHLLTPEEAEEANKSWQFFKKSQRDLTDQWKKFWAKKLVESYTSEEKTEEQTKSEEKRTIQEAENKLDWPEPPPVYEFWNRYHTTRKTFEQYANERRNLCQRPIARKEVFGHENLHRKHGLMRRSRRTLGSHVLQMQ